MWVTLPYTSFCLEKEIPAVFEIDLRGDLGNGSHNNQLYLGYSII